MATVTSVGSGGLSSLATYAQTQAQNDQTQLSNGTALPGLDLVTSQFIAGAPINYASLTSTQAASVPFLSYSNLGLGNQGDVAKDRDNLIDNYQGVVNQVKTNLQAQGKPVPSDADIRAILLSVMDGLDTTKSKGNQPLIDQSKSLLDPGNLQSLSNWLSPSTGHYKNVDSGVTDLNTIANVLQAKGAVNTSTFSANNQTLTFGQLGLGSDESWANSGSGTTSMASQINTALAAYGMPTMTPAQIRGVLLMVQDTETKGRQPPLDPTNLISAANLATIQGQLQNYKGVTDNNASPPTTTQIAAVLQIKAGMIPTGASSAENGFGPLSGSFHLNPLTEEPLVSMVTNELAMQGYPVAELDVGNTYAAFKQLSAAPGATGTPDATAVQQLAATFPHGSIAPDVSTTQAILTALNAAVNTGRYTDGIRV